MKTQKNQKRTNNGITLIALVITIIVLLILAGVTIATLTGENGILTQAGNAKTETIKAGAEEEVKLAIMASYGKDGKIDFPELNNNLRSLGLDTNIQFLPSQSLNYKGQEIIIRKDGSIFNVGEWDKTACKESSFLWESDDPTSGEAYHTIVGYADSIENETKLKIPSRCYEIRCDSSNWYNQGRTFAKTFKDIELPDTLVTIGGYAFSYFELTSIKIPDSVTSIRNYAINGCSSLTSIEIPNNVTRIEDFTFSDCTNLKNISISKNVSYIGFEAFKNCTSLVNIVIWQSVDEICYRTFGGWQNTQTINIETSQIPSGWDAGWNAECNANIVCAYTGE